MKEWLLGGALVAFVLFLIAAGVAVHLRNKTYGWIAGTGMGVSLGLVAVVLWWLE